MRPTITSVPLGGLFQLESNRPIYATRKRLKQNSQTKRPLLKLGLAGHSHSWGCTETQPAQNQKVWWLVG